MLSRSPRPPRPTSPAGVLAGVVAGVLAVGVGSLVAGCRRPPDDAPPASRGATTAPPPLSALPPDHLAPGELPEGTETAFGLALPRGFTVTARFDDSIFARGQSSPENVTNYVRRRVEAGATDVGPSRTVFGGARAKGKPNAPFVRIEVVEIPGGTEIVVRDLTPPPIEKGLSEEERWKKAGLKPNGEVLDPTHAY